MYPSLRIAKRRIAVESRYAVEVKRRRTHATSGRFYYKRPKHGRIEIDALAQRRLLNVSGGYEKSR